MHHVLGQEGPVREAELDAEGSALSDGGYQILLVAHIIFYLYSSANLFPHANPYFQQLSQMLIHFSHHLSLITLAILTLTSQILAFDCQWIPKQLSVVSNMKINRFRNCKQYCEQFYSKYPQRAYYNITSKNCEPIRLCNNFNHYYHYQSNSCYMDETLEQQTETYLPESMISSIELNTFIGSNHNMICVNGYRNLTKINGVMTCVCQRLWEHSGLLDLNGALFKCDRVTQHPEQHFYDRLQWNQKGQIVKYGNYTSQQMAIALKSLKIKQKMQTAKFIQKSYPSIIITLDKELPQQDYIRSEEWPYVLITLGLSLLVYAASLASYNEIRIPLSGRQVRRKMKRIILDRQ